MKSKTRLIIAKTHYQVIFAMQMRCTVFAEDYVTLLICDHSKNADIISQNLIELKLFSEVHYISTMGSGDSRTNIQKVEDFIRISFDNTNRYCNYTDQLIEKKYDELIVYNYSIETYGIYSILCQYNKNISVSRYEEGILSYNGCCMVTTRRKMINYVRRMQRKPCIEDHLYFFYCFYPNLYRDNLTAFRIPRIRANSEVCSLIAKTFDVNILDDAYKQKYIIFTSVYDFEGGEPIGEYEVVSKIASYVGKENVLIKTHPRDIRDIYSDNGFCVDRNSSIPWEAIQLSGDFSEKVFVTMTSGSVLAGSLMSDEPVKTFYMYKLCNIEGNKSALKTTSDIKSLLSEPSMEKTFSTVVVADRIEDILT